MATLWLTVRSKGDMGVTEFLLVMLLMWSAFICVYFRGRNIDVATWMWAFAILFRVTGLFAEPIFEDDWYRYLWDGRTFVAEGNPYDRQPAAYFAIEVTERFERILGDVNYPDVPTIYGPVCQYVFAASYLVAPGELWPLKVVLLLADCIVIWCLLRLTTVRNTLLYAWCPLAVFETAINAHAEILGVAPAIWCLFLSYRGRACSALSAIGIACAARIHATLLVPFILIRVERRNWWLLPVTFALVYAPFWLQGSLADWAGLKAFLGNWEFNSTVYAVLASTAGVQWAKVISGLGFALAYSLLWWSRKKHGQTVPRGDIIYGLFFLFSAVANPWYMLWLLPFVAVFPSVTGIVACAVVSLSYVHGLNVDSASLGPYEHPWWVRPAEVVAVVIAFAVDLMRRSMAKRKTR